MSSARLAGWPLSNARLPANGKRPHTWLGSRFDVLEGLGHLAVEENPEQVGRLILAPA